jgi:hypothetical protein
MAGRSSLLVPNNGLSFQAKASVISFLTTKFCFSFKGISRRTNLYLGIGRLWNQQCRWTTPGSIHRLLI